MAQLPGIFAALVAVTAYGSTVTEARDNWHVMAARRHLTQSSLGATLPGASPVTGGTVSGNGTTIKNHGRFTSTVVSSLSADCPDTTLQSAVFSCREVNTPRARSIPDVCVRICDVTAEDNTCAPCRNPAQACLQGAGNTGTWQAQFVRTLSIKCLISG